MPALSNTPGDRSDTIHLPFRGGVAVVEQNSALMSTLLYRLRRGIVRMFVIILNPC